MIRMEDAGALKRRMFHYFMDLARKVGPARMDGKPIGAVNGLLYALGDTAHAVASSLGHESPAVTFRSYVAPGTAQRANAKRILTVLKGGQR